MSKCDLCMLIDGCIVKVASGVVYPDRSTVHGTPVRQGYVVVCIHDVEATYNQFGLPIPTNEHETLIEACSSFVQWPNNHVLLKDVSSSL